MACRLAEAGMATCLLERGKAYPPGSFPRTPRDMSRNFWDPSNGGHGLFQVWAFDGIESVVSAGLGGGSLIYANVLLRKDEKWFVREDLRQGGVEYWPVTRQDLDPDYDEVESVLMPTPYPFQSEPYASTPKTVAFNAAATQAGLAWQLPPLAITFGNPGHAPVPGELVVDAAGHVPENYHGKARYTCSLVAECDVGCNSGSKNSLDYNFITRAARAGADVRTRCEVRSFTSRKGGGFDVYYVGHEAEHEHVKTDTQRLPLVKIGCKKLILSAGVFGSTYLLLKNKHAFAGLSSMLGKRFSSNGDLLGFVRNQRTGRDLNPMLGPVITSAVRVADALDGGSAGAQTAGATGRGFYVEEGGYPLFGGWALEAIDTPGQTKRFVRFVARAIQRAITRDPRSDLSGELGRLLGKTDSAGTMIMLGMGRDIPDGVMRLNKKWLALKWSDQSAMAYFSSVRDTMTKIATNLEADFTVYPLWYLRKLITVHGLGGCPMGTDSSTGVVNSYGEVFNCSGLYVADGSVMPGAVGANPSLTIAALANRFARNIIAPGEGAD